MLRLFCRCAKKKASRVGITNNNDIAFMTSIGVLLRSRKKLIRSASVYLLGLVKKFSRGGFQLEVHRVDDDTDNSQKSQA